MTTTTTTWADIKDKVGRDGLIADTDNRVWKRFGDAPIFLRSVEDDFTGEWQTVAWKVGDDDPARLLAEGDCGHDFGPFAGCTGSRCS